MCNIVALATRSNLLPILGNRLFGTSKNPWYAVLHVVPYMRENLVGIKFVDFSQNAVLLKLADFKFGDSVHVSILVGYGV